MSSLADLMEELCPTGVESRELQDLFTLRNGYTPSKSQKAFWEDGTVPWFRMEDIRENGRVLDDSLQHISESAVKGGRLFEADSIIVATSATIGEHALIRVPFLSNQRFTCLTLKPEYKDRFEPKFVYYYCFLLDEWCLANTTRSSFASVDMAGFRRFGFPIPPLEAQREIVRVLDLFTALESNLVEEFRARQLQYAFCSELLLTFPPDAKVTTLPLGQVTTIVRGASPRPIQSFITEDESGVPWIKIGDVAKTGKYITSTEERITPEGAAKSRRVRPGDFVLSNSMSFGRPYISKIDGYIHDGWLAISDFHESFLPDYLYHLLRSVPVQKEFERRAGGGTVRNLNAEIVRSVQVPIPPLQEQARIVEILDKFDTLLNDPVIGIPAEQRARKAQYEHYQRQLLTFQEAVA